MGQAIHNLSQLRFVWEKQCYYITDKAAQMIKEKIDEFIREYYHEYTPEQYKRTWTFLNSAVKTEPQKIRGGYKISIYIDTSLAYSNGWTMKGTAIQANLGLHGWYRAVKVGDTTHFWDEAIEEIPQIVLRAFGDFLSKKGIQFSYL